MYVFNRNSSKKELKNVRYILDIYHTYVYYFPLYMIYNTHTYYGICSVKNNLGIRNF